MLGLQNAFQNASPKSSNPEFSQSSAADRGRAAVHCAIKREKTSVVGNLRLRYQYFEYFVYSQWIPAWLLLLLRTLMGAACISVFIYVAVEKTHGTSIDKSSATTTTAASTATQSTRKSHFFLCYLTVWSYLMVTLYFVTALVNTLSAWICSCSRGAVVPTEAEESQDSRGSAGISDQSPSCCRINGRFSVTASGFKTEACLALVRGNRQSDDGKSIENQGDDGSDSSARQVGFRLQWLLSTVASDAALAVTLTYYSVLYRSSEKDGIRPLSLLQHGFNTVFMFLEIFTSGMPVRMINVVYAQVYALLYIIFSLCYWAKDNTNVIYNILLDWNSPALTVGILAGLVLLGLPLVHLIWWCLYLLRCFIGGALAARGTDERSTDVSA